MVEVSQGDLPSQNLPPVALPSLGLPREPLRITVGPDRKAGKGNDVWGAYVSPAKDAVEPGNVWGEYNPETKPAEPQQEVGSGEAALRGAAHGLTFGLTPAIAGLSEAAGPGVPEDTPLRPIMGGVKMLQNAFSDHPNPEVRAAYEHGRAEGLKKEHAAKEQHPNWFLGGEIAGGMMVPLGAGVGTAARLGGRVAQGMAAGGIGGGLTGAGEATSEGKSLPQIAKAGATQGAIAAPIGGAITGALGRRLVNANSPGQQAARTAEDLGVPLARGLASDNAGINATTSKMRSVPLVGSRISSDIDKLQTAAGGRVGEIADTMAGTATSRSAADAVVRPGLQTAIDSNRAAIDAGYNGLRGQINVGQQYTLPRTQRTLDAIVHDRRAAGWANPEQGLEQFRNVAAVATFNGAHRARVDAREAGNALTPHPGYNSADFNRVTRAMTADLRELVQAAATNQTANGRQTALRAFDKAETEFGRLAKENGLIQRLLNSKGEAAIATLLNSAKEKGGNLKLLAQLRQSMSPQDFETIGGLLIHEMGHNPTTGHFSLNKFATEFEKLSDGALSVLFSHSPSHLQQIKDIAGLGKHVKHALRESNTSHTAGVIVMFDLARDAVILTSTGLMGTMGLGTGVGAVTGAAGVMLARWLSSPSKAASMSAWSRAYRAMGEPTPARQAVFNIATRNLANTLGVPLERITQAVTSRVPVRADVEDQKR